MPEFARFRSGGTAGLRRRLRNAEAEQPCSSAAEGPRELPV